MKSKQIANKRHFTSDDLKADVYLYHLIQHFKARINQIESQDTATIARVERDVKMKDDSDDDSILDSSDDEDEQTRENSVITKSHKFEGFCDMLIRLFEKNILPFTELHYPQY